MRVVTTCLVLLLAPATAQATEVRFDGDPHSGVVTVTGGPEANRISVARDTELVVVRDEAAALTTAAPCRLREDGSAACPVGRPSVTTGEGNDIVTGAMSGTLDLGPGDDRGEGFDVAFGGAGDDTLIAGSPLVAELRGGPGADRLEGGRAADRLSGGAGADVVLGGDGDDLVEGHDVDGDYDGFLGPPREFAHEEEPAGDVLDGGAGRDRLSYLHRVGGVRVRLDRGEAGSPGERDQIAGFEDVWGSRGGDLIVGDGGPNAISGAGGLDRIDGAAGDDHLSEAGSFGGGRCCHPDGGDTFAGGAGDDTLEVGERSFADAGPGDDDITVRSTADWPSAIVCGEGADVIEAGLRDPLDPGCERLAFTIQGERATLSLHPRHDRTGVRLRLPCPARIDAGCRIRASLRRPLGGTRRVTVRLKPGSARVVRLPFPGRLRRSNSFRVVLRVAPDGRVHAWRPVVTGFSLRVDR